MFEIVNRITKDLIDYAFLPLREDNQKSLSKMLLIIAILIVITLAILSLPAIQQLAWSIGFTSFERKFFIVNKDYIKAWFDSATFILDLFIAIFIGGSIFGQRLANSFRNSIDKYEAIRELILDVESSDLSLEYKQAYQQSIDKIQAIRAGSALSMIRQITELVGEFNKVYRIAFLGVPRFYRYYLRFLLMSKFSGGTYGFIAFLLFLVSSGFKLASMYVGGPYLVE
ncbi:hypothetical protein EYS14_01575 [Alteromonadaceae bacterium M269]|nr:hypothetical protein EYS14_01575 [Alteromonadaceae bacterium M269]